MGRKIINISVELIVTENEYLWMDGWIGEWMNGCLP